MNTAEQVLNVPYPDFHWPLDKAKQWLFSDDRDLRCEAIKLLEGLEQQYPHAPQIGQMLVLGLIECGQSGRAEDKLVEVEGKLQNPDEETLCRWSRLFRERGEVALGKVHDDPAYQSIALQHFRKACQKYREAYLVRQGHYPLVNEAELYLVKASIDESNRASYRTQSRELATKLLDSQPNWLKVLPDDNIWHLATEAQAHLILCQWTEAIDKYQQAISQRGFKPFHAKSIHHGANRTLDALRRLGEANEDRARKLDELFDEANSPIE